jgi:hypothetical protein
MTTAATALHAVVPTVQCNALLLLLLLLLLVSSPLALMVALWGMTSDSTLHVMASRHDEATLTARIASPRQPEVNTSHL